MQLLELYEKESKENQGMKGKSGFFAYLAFIKRPWQIVNLQTREDILNFLHLKVYGTTQPNMKIFLPKHPWAKSSTKRKIGEIKSFYSKLITILGKDDSFLPLKSPSKVLERIYNEKKVKPQIEEVERQEVPLDDNLDDESSEDISEDEDEDLTEELSEDQESSISEYEEILPVQKVVEKAATKSRISSPRKKAAKVEPMIRQGPSHILNGTPPVGKYPTPFVVQNSFTDKRPGYSPSPWSLDTSQYITPPQSQNQSPEMLPLTLGDAQTSPLRHKLNDQHEGLEEDILDNSKLAAQPKLSAIEFINSVANDFESFPETFDFLERFTEQYFGLCGNPTSQDKILRVVKILIPVFKSSQDSNEIVGAMKMILETCDKMATK